MTDTDLGLDKINDKDLEKKIIEVNREELKSIKKASYFNAMYSLNTSKAHFTDEEMYNKKNYKDEYEKIISIMEEIEELIKKPDVNRAMELREALYKKKNILDGYLVEVSYLGELVDENGIKILSNTKEFAHFHRESVDELISIIQTSLDETQGNYNKYVFIISEIVKVLPMRMVKQNYYDTLREAMKRNFRNINKAFVNSQIDNFKKQFDSSTKDGYGMKFDYYFMEIHKIKREKLDEKSIEELAIYVEKIVDLTKELNSLKEIVQALGIVLNMIISISLLENINVDIEEILSNWIEIYNSNDEEKIFKFNKEIEERLSNIEKEIQKDVEYYQELTIEVSHRKDFNQESLDKELVKTREVLSYYNDVGFSDIEVLQAYDMEVVDDLYLDNCITSLFDYMDRSMMDMENKERKIRMRNIMSMVQLPFDNINEFINYVRYSLDSRVVDVKIINFKINQIVYFLKEIKDK